MIKRVSFWAAAVATCLALLGSFSVKAASCCICKEYRQMGFPEDYCARLCALKLQHPTWEFSPLLVTDHSRKEGKNYTFPFVLEQECVSDRSLVSSESVFSPYWHADGTRWDSGLYLASREAVAYFLDPRNHLTEKGMFQFLDLSYCRAVSSESILAFFHGSALQEAVDPVLLSRVGEEVGVDPLHLATRLRQEQGNEGNPLLYGTAGTKLNDWYENRTQWEGDRLVSAPVSGLDCSLLLSLDGYYNPFHISAGGKGSFDVYRNAASYAANMGWDTLEKGLRGGAQTIADEYILRHQNTLYLQKWNVDVRSRTENGESRNFWAQYMQNVGAAKTEGDALYRLYLDGKLLTESLCFLIPVYEEMPSLPSPDPANGAVTAFAAEDAPISPHRYPEASPVVQEKKEEEKTDPASAHRASPVAVAEEGSDGFYLAPWMRAALLLIFLAFSALLVFLLSVILRIFSPFLLPKIENNWRK